MHVNVFAALHLTNSAMPHLARNARILHLSSRAAQLHLPGVGLYSMSKAAIESITGTYADEMEGLLFATGIPGEVDTGMQADLRDAEAIRNLRRRFRIGVAVGDLRPSPSGALAEARRNLSLRSTVGDIRRCEISRSLLLHHFQRPTHRGFRHEIDRFVEMIDRDGIPALQQVSHFPFRPIQIDQQTSAADADREPETIDRFG